MELLFLCLNLHQLLEVCTFSRHGFKLYHRFCVCRPGFALLLSGDMQRVCNPLCRKEVQRERPAICCHHDQYQERFRSDEGLVRFATLNANLKENTPESRDLTRVCVGGIVVG